MAFDAEKVSDEQAQADVLTAVAQGRLKSFIERIERLEEDKKAVAEDMKGVFAEAKGEGFDVKILKEVIRLRKQEPKERDEHDMLLDTYLNAIERAEPILQARVLGEHR